MYHSERKVRPGTELFQYGGVDIETFSQIESKALMLVALMYPLASAWIVLPELEFVKLKKAVARTSEGW